MRPKNMVVNDYVIWEDICNLKCSYCKEDKKPFKRSGQFIKIGDKKYHIDELIDNASKTIEFSRSIINVPILKISGGELFLINEIVDLIKEESLHYNITQILTNNYQTNEKLLDNLSNIKNLHIQISLDGASYGMNSYRVKNENENELLLKNLDLLIEYDFPIEINCVITKRNIDGLWGYVEYLDNFDTNLILNLFPVRGFPEHLPFRNQLNDLNRLIQDYELHERVLPPLQYLIRLYEYLINGKRLWNCKIPFAVAGTYDNGDINLCTCSKNLPTLGNIYRDDKSQIHRKIHSTPYYELLNGIKYKSCLSCYIHYDLMNLYFDNLIELKQLSKIAFYSMPKVRENLRKLKRKITDMKITH